jgi:hypothetical protein
MPTGVLFCLAFKKRSAARVERRVARLLSGDPAHVDALVVGHDHRVALVHVAEDQLLFGLRVAAAAPATTTQVVGRVALRSKRVVSGLVGDDLGRQRQERLDHGRHAQQRLPELARRPVEQLLGPERRSVAVVDNRHLALLQHSPRGDAMKRTAVAVKRVLGRQHRPLRPSGRGTFGHAQQRQTEHKQNRSDPSHHHPPGTLTPDFGTCATTELGFKAHE